MLSGKKILIGVCGSIAAYKSAELVRLFVKKGAEVKVLMTDAACTFITPMTFSTLSKNPVSVDFIKNNQGEWTNHVELGLWADVLIIAPASANTLAKMAGGICDNLLLAVYLSARCPVFFAPAMDLDMWQHPATQKNIKTLIAYGNFILQPEHGELASGLIGMGRMAEPEAMLDHVEEFLGNVEQPLKDVKVLLTAGPTYEAIDPVRFIGNHSSGKMGYALAEVLARKGARVHLVSGPTNLFSRHPRIETVHVTSAQEMYDECIRVFPSVKIAVLSAAVADYAPEAQAEQKMKKGGDLNLLLIKTKDILAELGKQKAVDQLLIGFALETNDEQKHAEEKLKKKNLDFIVLNSLADKGAGFKGDTNKVTIIDKDGKVKPFELKSKAAVAQDIVQVLIQKYESRLTQFKIAAALNT